MTKMSPADEYEIPVPSRMKLKETKEEKAERIYRREQKRQGREQDRIKRANGWSPPRSAARDQSISPPRYGPRAGQRPQQKPPPPPTQLDDDDDDDDGIEFTHHNRATHREDREDWADRMAWFAAEEMGGPFAGWGGAPRFDPYGFSMGGGSSSSQRIPSRYQNGACPSTSSARSTYRDAAREVGLDGGRAPALGEMNEGEYADWVREGMYRLRHKAELEDAERRRAAQRERERQREAEAWREAEREAKRVDKLKRERGKVQEDAKKQERTRWRVRCTALMDGEVVSTELGFADVPWPAYTATGSEGVTVVLTPDDLGIDAVRDFLFALADDEAAASTPRKSTDDARRKVLRDAIRLFHPDRFFARVLPRVTEADKDKVKDGVERCSRLINDLLSK